MEKQKYLVKISSVVRVKTTLSLSLWQVCCRFPSPAPTIRKNRPRHTDARGQACRERKAGAIVACTRDVWISHGLVGANKFQTIL